MNAAGTGARVTLREAEIAEAILDGRFELNEIELID
jgi:hypothetical protein